MHPSPTRAALFLALVALILATWAEARSPDLEYSWAQPLPQGNPIFGLCFADDLRGWAVARAGTVLRTTDGGDSWQVQREWSPDYADLFDVEYLPDGTLVACGGEGRVHRSTDDGRTWQRIDTGATGQLRDVALRPDGAVSVTGEAGVLLVSTDDGITWNDVGPGVGRGHHHLWKSSTEVFLVGEGLAHRSVDGGATWTQVFTPPFGGLQEVFLLDPDTVIALFGNGHGRSDDGGGTWTMTSTFQGPFYLIGSARLTDEHWLGISHGEGGRLWETRDAGQSWAQLLYRDCVGLTAIERLPSGRLVMASDIGDLMVSDDDGSNWTNRVDNRFGEGIYADIASFIFRPDGVLFTVNREPNQGQQTWLRSDDDGASWYRPAAAPDAPGLGEGLFVDRRLGLVVGFQTLARTIDGGQSWQNVPLPTDSGSAGEIGMASRQQIYLTTSRSDGGALWRSRDEGLTWQRVVQGLPSSFPIYGLALRPDGLGLCGGGQSGQGALYRTIDGGETWSSVSWTGGPILDIAWADESRVFAVDGDHTWRSESAGVTWQRVDDPWASKVRFTDARRGMVFGRTATVRITDDGGETWHTVDPPLASSLRDRSVYDRITAATPVPGGWLLGGEQSRILRAEGLTVTGVPDTAPPASGVRITSVRPNPFNPRVTVRFALDSRARVPRVFDVRGRRVRAFDPGIHDAGRHALHWDGTDDRGRPVASGLYLLHLRASGTTATARLVLAR